jgi:hypothetical protein
MRLVSVGCLLIVVIYAGCQPAANTATQDADHDHEHDHDHSDRPESLRAAIVELKEMRDQIRTAMDNNDPDSAHEPLHDVGKLLAAMPELAADTDLPESEWQEIKQEVDQLFKAFGDVDASFHTKGADKQAAYEAVKSIIDEGVTALEAKLSQLGDDPSQSPDEHRHHENNVAENHD